MKFSNVFILFLGLCFLASCSNEEDSATNIQLNELFQIKIDETLSFDDADIKITTDSISDSRCPVNSVCVWEGLVDVVLTTKINNVDYPLVLTLHEGHPQKAEKELGGYTFRLVTVSPHPTDTEVLAPEDYTISMVVEE